MLAPLPAVRESGVPFGFVFTLTQANLPSLVQIHPLEAEGQAARQLAGAVPDGRELAFAALETLRLQQALGEGPTLPIDGAIDSDLRYAPQRFLALPAAPPCP